MQEADHRPLLPNAGRTDTLVIQAKPVGAPGAAGAEFPNTLDLNNSSLEPRRRRDAENAQSKPRDGCHPVGVASDGMELKLEHRTSVAPQEIHIVSRAILRPRGNALQDRTAVSAITLRLRASAVQRLA
jgi:hypothetical protein